MAASLSDSALQTRLERLRRRLAHAEEAHRRGQAVAPEALRSHVRAAEEAVGGEEPHQTMRAAHADAAPA